MNNKNFMKNLFIFMLLLAPVANANAAVTLASMAANFSASGLVLIQLVQYSAYLIGLFLVIGSIFKFVKLGEDHHMTPKVPLMMFFTGIGIFALTGTISIVSETMAMGSGPGDILAPTVSSLGATTGAAIQGILIFIRLVGYIAFIRGWLLLNESAQGKEGVISRGLTHIGGGVAAINLTIFAHILVNTFAPGMTLPF